MSKFVAFTLLSILWSLGAVAQPNIECICSYDEFYIHGGNYGVSSFLVGQDMDDMRNQVVSTFSKYIDEGKKAHQLQLAMITVECRQSPTDKYRLVPSLKMSQRFDK